MARRQRSFVRLFYHFVWSTKYREPLITPKIEEILRDSFWKKAKELKFDILECDGTEDHTHIVVRAPATLAPSDIAKHLKGSSSFLANHDGERRNLYWQDGYGVVSIGPSALPTVRKYVRNQKEHHKAGTTDDSLEQTEEDD